jgi:hypothetical protein
MASALERGEEPTTNVAGGTGEEDEGRRGCGGTGGGHMNKLHFATLGVP